MNLLDFRKHIATQIAPKDFSLTQSKDVYAIQAYITKYLFGSTRNDKQNVNLLDEQNFNIPMAIEKMRNAINTSKTKHYPNLSLKDIDNIINKVNDLLIKEKNKQQPQLINDSNKLYTTLKNLKETLITEITNLLEGNKDKCYNPTISNGKGFNTNKKYTIDNISAYINLLMFKYYKNNDDRVIVDFSKSTFDVSKACTDFENKLKTDARYQYLTKEVIEQIINICKMYLDMHLNHGVNRNKPVLSSPLIYSQQASSSSSSSSSRDSNVKQVGVVKALSDTLTIPLAPMPIVNEPRAEEGSLSTKRTLQQKSANIQTIDADVLLIAEGLKTAQPKTSILVQNLANRTVAGGGWELGSMAQEESIMYRTNYYKSLYQLCLNMETKSQSRNYYEQALQHNTVYYSKDITVLFDQSYSEVLPANRFVIDLLAVAGYDLGKQNRGNHGEPNLSKLDKSNPQEKILLDAYNLDMSNKDYCFSTLAAKFIEATKDKILLTLKAAFDNKNDSLILGAISCGAFKFIADELHASKKETWTVDCVVEAYKRAFKEANQQGWLEHLSNIIFAIKITKPEDQILYDKFVELPNQLSLIIEKYAVDDDNAAKRSKVYRANAS